MDASSEYLGFHVGNCEYSYTIKEELSLFSVEKYRWLYNDEQQRAVRYLPFNVDAFLDVAVRSAGATRCTSFEKVQDGTMNRVFSLRFDNDTEFIAKVPFPVAGPRHYCTASEVATLDFLRTELHVPVPQVRAWCSRADSSPVGVEYIMYDRIPGVQLYSYDETDLPVEDDPYVDVLPELLGFESALAKLRFAQIGSLYYKEDVPEGLRERPLYASDFPSTLNSQRFCIGPTTDREFWRAGRAHLKIDRGPWNDEHAYMYALAACARAFLDLQPDTPVRDEYRRLIGDYETLVPHMAPNPSPYVLWHPDLHAGNILVTRATNECKLEGIIDWQGALVAPPFIHVACPPAYTAEEHPLIDYSDGGCPELTPEANALDGEQRRRVERACRHAWRQKIHEILLEDVDPKLAQDIHGIFGVTPKRYAASPTVAITRGAEEGLVFIRQSFLRTRTMWNAKVGTDPNGNPYKPFPLDITDADAHRIDEEWERHAHDASMCNELLERLGSPLESEGLVDADKYDEAKRAVEEARQAALDAALNANERERIAKAWPLQDGKVSLTAEVCC